MMLSRGRHLKSSKRSRCSNRGLYNNALPFRQGRWATSMGKAD